MLTGANFNRKPGTFLDVMLRLVLAAVAVHRNSGREFFERLAQGILRPYGHRHGMNHSSAATVFCATAVRWQRRGHARLRRGNLEINILLRSESMRRKVMCERVKETSIIKSGQSTESK